MFSLGTERESSTPTFKPRVKHSPDDTGRHVRFRLNLPVLFVHASVTALACFGCKAAQRHGSYCTHLHVVLRLSAGRRYLLWHA